jgi:hypothetical protein
MPVEVNLKEGDLLSNMLEGCIRSNLRQARHSIYVEVVLSADERQQRKDMQQLQPELHQQGARTWWVSLMRRCRPQTQPGKNCPSTSRVPGVYSLT